jgi:RND family efflux transporter MFP subunit
MARNLPKVRIRIVPLLITLATTALAGVLGWAMWEAYMGAPWTRDGTVRSYVVTMAPEVAGRIVELPVADDQFVHKGDLLVMIEPTDYRIAVELAQPEQQTASTLGQSQATLRSAQASVTLAERQIASLKAQLASAEASVAQATAQLHQAGVNLKRTQIHSPVNGWVTNLLAQLGDYATVGRNVISLVNADSFWVDAYFEETQLASVHEGDPAMIKLLGYRAIVRGEVAGVARGINVPNAQPNAQGLAVVNPIFTWVRLAQRVPVRIRINQVPDGVRLVAGMTATVQIDPLPARPAERQFRQ